MFDDKEVFSELNFVCHTKCVWKVPFVLGKRSALTGSSLRQSWRIDIKMNGEGMFKIILTRVSALRYNRSQKMFLKVQHKMYTLYLIND